MLEYPIVALVYTRRSKKAERPYDSVRSGYAENHAEPREKALTAAYGLFQTLWS